MLEEIDMLRSKVKELEIRLKKYTNGSNHKKYYEKNKERYKESGSEYLKKLKEENPERLKEYRKRAYEKRKEKLKEKEKCDMEVSSGGVCSVDNDPFVSGFCSTFVKSGSGGGVCSVDDEEECGGCNENIVMMPAACGDTAEVGEDIDNLYNLK